VAHPGAPFPAPRIGGVAWSPPAGYTLPLVHPLGSTIPAAAAGVHGSQAGLDARHVGHLVGQALVNHLQGTSTNPWINRFQHDLGQGIQGPPLPPLNPGGPPGGPPVSQNPFGYPYPPGWMNATVDYLRGL